MTVNGQEGEATRRNQESSNTEVVAVTVSLTPEEFVRINRDASWEGCTVAEYLRRYALGKTRRGC